MTIKVGDIFTADIIHNRDQARRRALEARR
jgi:hypothetical protein